MRFRDCAALVVLVFALVAAPVTAASGSGSPGVDAGENRTISSGETQIVANVSAPQTLRGDTANISVTAIVDGDQAVSTYVELTRNENRTVNVGNHTFESGLHNFTIIAEYTRGGKTYRSNSSVALTVKETTTEGDQTISIEIPEPKLTPYEQCLEEAEEQILKTKWECNDEFGKPPLTGYSFFGSD